MFVYRYTTEMVVGWVLCVCVCVCVCVRAREMDVRDPSPPAETLCLSQGSRHDWA